MEVGVTDMFHDPVDRSLQALIAGEVERLLAHLFGHVHHLLELRHEVGVEVGLRRRLQQLWQRLLAGLHARAAQRRQLDLVGHVHRHVQLVRHPVLGHGELPQLDQEVVREGRQAHDPDKNHGNYKVESR